MGALAALSRRYLQRFTIRGRRTGCITTSTAEKTTTFSLGQPPVPGEQFYIETAADVEKFHKETNDQDLVLVRGPPGCGKSTVAEAICRLYPCSNFNEHEQRSYVFLPAQHLEDQAKIIKQLNKEENLDGILPPDDLHAAIEWLIRHNIAVVVDEAHCIFETSNDPKRKAIYSAFLKHDKHLTGLFFTTSSEAVTEKNVVQHSPPEMSKKFFWIGQIDAGEIKAELERSPVNLSTDAARALIQISGVNRGIFVRLCTWVEKKQMNEPKVFFFRDVTCLLALVWINCVCVCVCVCV